MKAKTRARLLAGASGLFAALVGVGAPTTALAQTSEEAAADDEIVVTAQRREERIQDVPIAITALSEENLSAQRIEGGPDLLRAIPNVTFSRGNFTSNNFAIRGVGTKAVSATTDPGVAVSFNQTGIIQNRLFEQEYYDMERVEILRGPQGTLFGRNATGGVINLVPRGVDFDEFGGNWEVEIGNFDTRRLSGMVNIPIIDDRLAIRFAGALTERSGYDFNTVTRNHVNGRELWSGRMTLGFEPTNNFRGSLIWEHFDEDDNRSRTGKQLCNRDEPPEMIGSTTVIDGTDLFSTLGRPAIFSTGCEAGSLYSAEAFGTPNGASIPFVLSSWTSAASFAWGYLPDPDNPGQYINSGLLQMRDPYGGLMQSPDLREIASFRDPIYRAQADIFQLNLEYDISDSLTFNSQTMYVEDSVYSFQNANRFNTLPFFNDTTQFVEPWWSSAGPSPFQNVAPGGVFCDPQVGCSNTMAGFDVSRADATQFAQEFRLSSSFDGPLNFSIGANYTRFETLSQYYVMNNVLTALAMSMPFNGSGTIDQCGMDGLPMEQSWACVYIDPNSFENMNGEGHNYFRSVNPYELTSTAVFGELYWNATDSLKITAGLRYTEDQKTFDVVPTQLLMAPHILSGGVINRGLPTRDTIELDWGEWTGRFGFDWRPDFGFTDESLLYAFYSRGYKAGGMNPPLPEFATGEEWVEAGYIDQATYDMYAAIGMLPVLNLIGQEYGATFEPEFVNAFEIGSKNTLFDGAMMLNLTGFYYDYSNYQVSQIRNRSAVNENFDADVWGAEIEMQWEPFEGLRINSNLGYLRTRIADGESSIDIINRTLGDPNYTVSRAWAQIPSNCVVPTAVAESFLNDPALSGIQGYWSLCGGYGALGILTGPPIDPSTGMPFDINNYPELNGGSGLATDLSGHELPNSPRWTFNLGAEYEWMLGGDWTATVRGDYYWQDDSFHRVYNFEPYDRLQGWDYVNLGIWFDRGENLRVEFYVRNVFDESPITDAFLNSDDQGLTTNIFTLDPRIFGASVRARF